MIRKVAGGLLLGGILAALHFGILLLSLLTPGSLLNSSVKASRPLGAAHPSEREIQTWFDLAGKVVIFSSVVVPIVLGIVCGIVLVIRKRASAESLIALVCAYALGLTLEFGFGKNDVIGVGLFAFIIFGTWFALRRTGRMAAA